jgi:PEP-CTERM motif
MRKLIGAFLIGFLAISAASASEWLYTYTGNDLTDVTSACCGQDTPFTTSDFIKFQFTSPYLLAPNLNDTGFPGAITSWSLSLGPLSYSSAGGPTNVLYSINFSTNAAAQITGYQFTTQTDVVAPDLLPFEYGPQIYLEEVFSADLPGIFCCEDAIYIPQIFMDSDYASNANNPGIWAIMSIPEPSTWAMLLSGLVGLSLAGRGRRWTGAGKAA